GSAGKLRSSNNRQVSGLFGKVGSRQPEIYYLRAVWNGSRPRNRCKSLTPHRSHTSILELNPALIVALETNTPLLRWTTIKMAMNRLALGVLLLSLSGQAQAASSWETFTSQYSGCSVEYPRYIFTPSEQTTADGATRFSSGLAEAEMVIAGGSNNKNV